MLTVEALRRYGANVEDGLNRCLNNKAFYFRMIGMALQSDGFEKLKEAVAQNDLQAAFEQAHSLKGVLGNLALTPLFEPVSNMTEELRAKTERDYSPYLEEIFKQKALLNDLLA